MPFDSTNYPSSEVKTEPTVDDVLREALDLIRKGWCQGTAARNECGLAVDFRSEGAANYCSLGAVARASMNLTNAQTELDHSGLPIPSDEYKVLYNGASSRLSAVLYQINPSLPIVSLYNDSQSRERVIEMFELALKVYTK